MKYCPKRIEKIQEYCDKNGIVLTDDNIIEMMDNWLIDLWNSQVTKKDTVYILGDFSFHNAEENKKLLAKLNGTKFLILGNHDGNSDKLTNYFQQITQIKELKYKDESGETFCFELCHYAMVTWNRKEHGTIQLHGHSHGSLDGFNESNPDLRVDVGLDGHLANYRFLTPDDILVYFYQKAATKDFENYVQALRNNGKNEVSKVKFDSCGEFHEGFARVKLNNKYNWVRQDNGQYFSDKWFDDCGEFYEGFAAVELNGKWNWVCQYNNQYFSDQWFDMCGSFHGGVTIVKLNGKCNWVRQDNGEYFSEQWFDNCGYFNEGVAWVELNNKYNWVRQDNDQLLSEQWFDVCGDFREGFAAVELNGKWNWVCQDNGQLLSEQWFDDCGSFNEGFAVVELNNKYYLMRQDGVLCDLDTKEPIEKEN